MTLQEQLDLVQVSEVDAYHNEVNGGGLTAILGWFMVDDGNGAVAYFALESAAFHHRLTLINNRLNRLGSED